MNSMAFKQAIQGKNVVMALQDPQVKAQMGGMLMLAKPAIDGNMTKKDDLKRYLLKQLNSLPSKIRQLTKKVSLQEVAGGNIQFVVTLDTDRNVRISEDETLEMLQKLYENDIISGEKSHHKIQNYLTDKELHSITSISSKESQLSHKRKVRILIWLNY